MNESIMHQMTKTIYSADLASFVLQLLLEIGNATEVKLCLVYSCILNNKQWETRMIHVNF